jgi:hypothetical protein
MSGRVAVIASALLLQLSVAAGYEADHVSALRISHIIPGTEQVQLLPYGDFESGPWTSRINGRGQEGWFPETTGWGQFLRHEHLFEVPGVCGRQGTMVSTDWSGGNRFFVGIPDKPFYPTWDGDWRRAYGMYYWSPGNAQTHLDSIDSGYPGAQHMGFGWHGDEGDLSAFARDGFYLMMEFPPYNAQFNRYFWYNPKAHFGVNGKPAPHRTGFVGDDGKWKTIIIVNDNLSDTRLGDFAPPVLRHAAAWDFAAMAGKGASLESLAAAVKANPSSAQAHNALAAASVAAFARDTSRMDLLRGAMAAWEASLAADADQPHVRYWLKVYGGYRPPWRPPAAQTPQDVPADPVQTPGALANQMATMLRASSVLPGTERVSLIDDFENGLGKWQVTAGKEGFAAGKPQIEVRRVPKFYKGWAVGAAQMPPYQPIAYRGQFLYCPVLDEGAQAEIELSGKVAIEAGKEYIVSAWVCPLVDSQQHFGSLAIGIDGQHQMWLPAPRHQNTGQYQEGFFVYGSFTASRATSGPLRVRLGPWSAPPAAADAVAVLKETRQPVGILIDELAITAAQDFRPPMFRSAALHEVRGLLRLDVGMAAATQPATGSAPARADAAERLAAGLAAVWRDRPDWPADAAACFAAAAAMEPTPRAHNLAACAYMAEYLAALGDAEPRAKALEHWRASLKLRPGQPEVSRLLELLESHKPFAQGVVIPYRIPRPVECAILPGGGQAASGQQAVVTVVAESIGTLPEGLTLRCTTDGSDVGAASPAAQGPLLVSPGTTIKVAGFVDGKLVTQVATATISPGEPLAAVEGGKVTPGLTYTQYSAVGRGKGAADLNTAKVVATQAVGRMRLEEWMRDDAFGFGFDGWLDVPADATYTFGVRSFNGTALWIDGRLVVDNQGEHPPRQRAGCVPLKAGMHAVRLAAASRIQGDDLRVSWESAQMAREELPADRLWRQPPASQPASGPTTQPAR